jgi:hypothetical protein
MDESVGMWYLWTIHKLTFEAKVLKHPADAMFRVTFFFTSLEAFVGGGPGAFFEEAIK